MKIIDLILNEIACKTYKHLHGDSLYQIFTEDGNYYVYLKKIAPAFLPHNNDITRIQIPNLPAFNEVVRSSSAFFAIGYDPINDVYAIWNPDAVKPRLNKKKNVSLYSTFSGQQKVRTMQKPLHYVSKQLQDAMIVPLSKLKAVLTNYSSYFNSTEMPELPNLEDSNQTNDWETPYIDANGKLTKLANPKLLALLKPCFDSPYPTYVQAYNIIEDFYGMDRFPKMQFKDWEYLLTHIDWNSTINTEPVKENVKPEEKGSGRRRWTDEEMILSLELYYRLPFSKFSGRTPEVQQLALITGRTPSSIAMRLCNYEYSRTGKGLSGGHRQCLPFVEKYEHNRAQLTLDAQEILAKIPDNGTLVTEEPVKEKQPNVPKENNAYGKFFDEFILYNKQVQGPFADSKGTTHDWLGKFTIGIKGVSTNIIIARKACRGEIFINSGSKEENKRIFDFYYSHRQEIDKEIPDLVWQRLEEKNTCRIRTDRQLSFLRPEDKEEIFHFFIDITNDFLRVFSKYTPEYAKYKENPVEENEATSAWSKLTSIFHKK